MNKKVLILHRILFAADVAFLAAGLVMFLVKWSSLPENIGMHFGSDGSFDVVASKYYGFYPQVIGSILIAGIAAADRFIIKKSSGMRIDSSGEAIFKAELILTLDFFLMFWCIYFGLWGRSVALQVPLPDEFLGWGTLILSAIILAGIAAQIVTFNLHKQKKDMTRSAIQSHRLSRIVSWLLTAGTVWMLAEIWNRLPGDEKYYFDPDYSGLAYFANFGRFMDKRLLLIPFVLGVSILAVIEIFSVRVQKQGKLALMTLTDDLRVFCAVFIFVCEVTLCSEMPVTPVHIGIFAAFVTASAVKYFVRKRTNNK